MSGDNIAQELAAMREQLDRLQQARTAQGPGVSGGAPLGESVSSPSGEQELPDQAWLDNLDIAEAMENLKSGAGEWLQEFDAELKDTRPSTLLILFGLGFLAGRLTS